MNKEMSQLYSRVFLQILDSSIAEDFTVRHVFEDFLKLCDHKSGVVDMTRQALSRRLNVPMETLNHAIGVLESPDTASRDMAYDGRRIERLDQHRDWGWKILNWDKYESVRTKADVYLRVSRHREKVSEESGKFKKPSLEEVKLHFSKSGLPMDEAESFFNYYESNGWHVGKNPMKNWHAAAANWKRHYEQRRYEHSSQPSGGRSASVDAMIKDKELTRVEERIKVIRGQASIDAFGTRKYEEKQRQELSDLKARKQQLIHELGMKA